MVDVYSSKFDFSLYHFTVLKEHQEFTKKIPWMISMNWWRKRKKFRSFLCPLWKVMYKSCWLDAFQGQILALDFYIKKYIFNTIHSVKNEWYLLLNFFSLVRKTLHIKPFHMYLYSSYMCKYIWYIYRMLFYIYYILFLKPEFSYWR